MSDKYLESIFVERRTAVFVVGFDFPFVVIVGASLKWAQAGGSMEVERKKLYGAHWNWLGLRHRWWCKWKEGEEYAASEACVPWRGIPETQQTPTSGVDHYVASCLSTEIKTCGFNVTHFLRLTNMWLNKVLGNSVHSHRLRRVFAFLFRGYPKGILTLVPIIIN